MNLKAFIGKLKKKDNPILVKNIDILQGGGGTTDTDARITVGNTTFTTEVSWGFTGGHTPSFSGSLNWPTPDATNTLFYEINVVPEARHYAMIFGMIGLGFTLAQRKRKSLTR